MAARRRIYLANRKCSGQKARGAFVPGWPYENSRVRYRRATIVARHEAAVETQETFVGRITALLTTLIADIVGDDAAGPLSSQTWKPSQIRAEAQSLCRLRCYLAA